MKAIKKGDLSKANKLIMKNKNLSVGEKKKLLATIQKKGGEYSAYSDEKKVKDKIFHSATRILKDDEKNELTVVVNQLRYQYRRYHRRQYRQVCTNLLAQLVRLVHLHTYQARIHV